MASGRPPFWKVLVGIALTPAVAGIYLVGHHLLMRRKTALRVSREQAHYSAQLVPCRIKFERLGDWCYVRGRLENHAQKTVNSWKVAVEYRNEQGTVIDTDYTTSRETLAPGQSKNFEVIHRDNPLYDTVLLSVEDMRLVQ